MASGQYFTGLVLLVLLIRDPVLVSSQTTDMSTDDPTSDPPTATPMMTNMATVEATTGGVTSQNMGSTAMPVTTDSPASTSSSSNDTMTSKISCRQFSCNESDCYSTFSSQTATACNSSYSYCVLQRMQDMSYWVGCSSDCPSTACVNVTQTGCSAACCNMTDCLNSTLLSMVPTTAAPTTKPTTKPTTVGNNGKKCHKLTCTGEKCYTDEKQKKKIMLCPNGQNYCKLWKTVSGAVMTWKGGCSGDCGKDKVCDSTAVDCTQECCNATKTASCLKLDGNVYHPNLAPYPAIGSASSLLASVLLTWLMSSQFHSL